MNFFAYSANIKGITSILNKTPMIDVLVRIFSVQHRSLYDCSNLTSH